MISFSFFYYQHIQSNFFIQQLNYILLCFYPIIDSLLFFFYVVLFESNQTESPLTSTTHISILVEQHYNLCKLFYCMY
jgi:hypothetical protein